MRDLEFIELITSGYRGNMLRAISELAECIDTPVTVRCPRLGSVAANTAYLDMMRLTHRQYERMSILETCNPEDRATGQAREWFQQSMAAVRNGRGAVRVRLWNGREVLPTRTDQLMVGDWLVSEIQPVQGLRVVRPVPGPACVRPAGTGKTPELRVVPSHVDRGRMHHVRPPRRTRKL